MPQKETLSIESVNLHENNDSQLDFNQMLPKDLVFQHLIEDRKRTQEIYSKWKVCYTIKQYNTIKPSDIIQILSLKR